MRSVCAEIGIFSNGNHRPSLGSEIVSFWLDFALLHRQGLSDVRRTEYIEMAEKREEPFVVAGRIYRREIMKLIWILPALSLLGIM